LLLPLASSLTIVSPQNLAGTHINSPIVNPTIYKYFPARGSFFDFSSQDVLETTDFQNGSFSLELAHECYLPYHLTALPNREPNRQSMFSRLWPFRGSKRTATLFFW
jgi:hypothetical protein